MCDGGWGLVCPEAHEAAAADGALLQQLELGRSSWFLIGHERQSATPVTAGHGHHHTSGTHTSAELPGLPSLRSSICRREPTNLSVERGGVGESGWKGRRQLRRVQRVWGPHVWAAGIESRHCELIWVSAYELWPGALLGRWGVGSADQLVFGHLGVGLGELQPQSLGNLWVKSYPVQGILSSLRLWSTVKTDKPHWLFRSELYQGAFIALKWSEEEIELPRFNIQW